MPDDVQELARHRIPRAVFDQFCAGAIDAEAVTAIQAGVCSRRRLLLCALLDVVAGIPDAVGPLNDPEDAWRVLAAADDKHPAVVEEILTHPAVGVWVSRTLCKARGARPDLIPLWTDLGYLHCLTAAAAIRTGVPCELRLPVNHGVVTLPTVGQIQILGSFPIGFVELTVRAGEVTVTARSVLVRFTADEQGQEFVPVRRHRCEAGGITLDIEIDDCDPYREFSASVAPHRLDEIALAHWCKQISEAWQILASWHRPHALELSASMRTLVPIPSGGLTGASSPAAFGATALGPADSATSLAQNLLHEIQHSKLNALFDILPLRQDDGMARWYAPWRDDPRPLAGVLHGLYAFITAVEFWLVQRDLVPEVEAPAANFEFALRRHQIREAVTALRKTEEVTELGRALVAALDARLARCEEAELSSRLTKLVTTLTDDHRMIWRLRHVRPSRTDVTILATAWLGESAAPPHSDVVSTVVPSLRTLEPSSRAGLLRMRALAPDGSPLAVRGSSVGDIALATGDDAGARTAYLARIRAKPNDIHAWSGLGLALRSMRARGAAITLATRPEVVYAVHHELLGLEAAPDPIELAAWLGFLPAE